MNDDTITMIIKVRDEAHAEITKVRDQLDGMSDSAGKSGLSFLSMASAVAVGQAALQGLEAVGRTVIGFFKSSIDSAAGYQDSLLGMEQGLRNSGQEVANNSKAIQDQAQALQLTTKFSDDAILSADAMLTTNRLSAETIMKLNPALLDMAEGLRDETGQTIGLTAAAKMMDKVMGGSADGVAGLSTALQKNGIMMTAAQKETFKTGTEVQRANALVEVMSKNFGGRALAAAEGYSGKMTILGNIYDDVKKKIGLALINGLTPFISKLIEWVQTDQAQAKIEMITKKVAEMTEKMVKWVTEVAVPWITQHWPEIKRVVNEVVKAIGDVIKFIWDNKTAFEAFIAMIAAVKLIETVSGIAKAFQLLGIASGGLPTLIAIGVAIDVDQILKAVDAAKQLKSTVGSMDDKTKSAWWSSMNWWEKTVSFATGATDWKIPVGGSGGYAGGGLVYASSGFNPQGSDTVPAMLTPGEMVLNQGQQTSLFNQLNGQGGKSKSQNITINFNGDIRNTDDKSLDEIGKRLARQLELAHLGVLI